MSDVGFLYALANSSMPGLVKVGKTTRSPTDRAAELSGVTGVATPFMVVYEQLFQDCHFAESFVHAYLAEKGHRVADNREFFNAPVSVVVRAIGLAPGAVDGESLQAESEPMDELIGEAVGDDLDDMQLTPVARTDPWTDIYAEALNHWHGFDNYLKDEVEAVRLFRQAATLGSTEAYTRLGFAYQVGFEGTAADKEKALKFYKEGARKGRPYCYLRMVQIFAADGQIENANKCCELFMQNLSTGSLDAGSLSDWESAMMSSTCCQLVAERFLYPAKSDQYAVLNGFFKKRAHELHVAAVEQIELTRSLGGEPYFLSAYASAAAYFMSLLTKTPTT